MNSAAAIDAILSELDLHSSPLLTYHTPSHTRYVIAAATRVAEAEGVSDLELEIIRTAAAYHDCGFLRSTVHHETAGMNTVKELLPNFGYSSEEIELISRMILSTELPQSASNQLEKILCDADLSYLGSGNYTEIANTFRQERANLGHPMTDQAWRDLQIGFLEEHCYWTSFAKSQFDEAKAKALHRLKKAQ